MKTKIPLYCVPYAVNPAEIWKLAAMMINIAEILWIHLYS